MGIIGLSICGKQTVKNIIIDIIVAFSLKMLASKTASLITQFLTKANAPDFLIEYKCLRAKLCQ